MDDSVANALAKLTTTDAKSVTREQFRPMTLRLQSSLSMSLIAWSLLMIMHADCHAQNVQNLQNVQDHSRFCVREGDAWVVQSYAPLVDTRNGTVIEQAVYSAGHLTHVVVKNYNQRYELLYDYRFAGDGKLIGLRGYLQKWGSWLAEADLFPSADGLIPKFDVQYRLDTGGGIIPDPKDGPDYTQVFRSVPVYGMETLVPCAALLQQAEKTNATQE